MKYDAKLRRIVLNEDELQNYLNIDGIDYQLEYLDQEDHDRSYSPNGFIFKLRNLQEEKITSIIKICKVFQPCKDKKKYCYIERFNREIKALLKIKEYSLNDHVIEIYTNKEFEIDGKFFTYYTMEIAYDNLASFLQTTRIELPQKFRICSDIINSIYNLHKIGIYHRDIKPGNFLIVNNIWKISDLGLVDFRDADLATIDNENEKVGPRGYLSPEAINKWLGANRDPAKIHIDDKSDVFQLARVIGFILYGEIFSGIIEPADLDLYENSTTDPLFTIMSQAMLYSKSRRSDLNTLKNNFKDAFGEKYAL